MPRHRLHLLLLGVLLSAAPCRAGERMATAALTFTNLSDDEPLQLRDVIRETLTKASVTSVDTVAAERCDEPVSCGQTARRLRADAVLGGRFRRSDRTLIGELWLYDVAYDQLNQAELIVCASCTMRAFTERTRGTVAGLVAPYRKRKHAFLRVQVSPPTAVLSLDGQAIGAGDGELCVRPGRHRVTAQLGDSTVEQEAQVDAGAAASVTLALPRLAAAAVAAVASPPLLSPPIYATHSRLRRTGLALGITGSAAVAGAIAPIALDNSCRAHCVYLRDYDWGYGLLAGGIAVAVTGWTMYLVAGHHAR